MTTGIRGKRRLLSRQYRSTPYPLPCWEILDKDVHQKKKCLKSFEKGDWEDAVCSVCLEYPHNAVLLLCSSHDKGCRPYMCATSYRFSNCLDQFEKAYTKTMSPPREEPWNGSAEDTIAGAGSTTWPTTQKSEVMDLICPLCRGQVKGWTVVEAAREFLNAKKRSCMQENCPFAGTYKELRKHVKREHPSARPREVDPALEQKWKRLQNERDRDDVISTIRSSMPGAMVLGDYVIERNHHHNNFDMEDEEGVGEEDIGYEMGIDNSNFLNVLFLLQAIGPSGNGSLNSRFRRLGRGYRSLLDGEGGRSGVPPNPEANGAAIEAASEDEEEEEDDDDDVTLLGRRRGRVVRLGRSERRRRQRSQRRSTLDVT